MKYLLDTHVWVWWYMNPGKLSQTVLQRIADKNQHDELLLSAISPWEFCKLIEKGRIAISCAPNEWLSAAFDLPGFRLVPLSPPVAYRSTVLPQPFHSDPADQIIVATAIEENATILTRDRDILEYEHVESLW